MTRAYHKKIYDFSEVKPTIIDVKGRKLTNLDVHLNDVTSPEKRLALAILNGAKEQASKGDMAALAFLITAGLDLEAYMLPSRLEDAAGDSLVLEFCKKVWAKVESGELKPNWATKDITKVFARLYKQDEMSVFLLAETPI